MTASNRSILARGLAAFAAALVITALTSVQALAANQVRLTASTTRPQVATSVTLTARVAPAVSGRTVVFQERAAGRWESFATRSTNGSGVARAAHRFSRAGVVDVRVIARPHRGSPQRTATLQVTVVPAPTRVTATFPAGPWTIGEPVGVPVAVGPADASRRVWLERNDSGTWVRISDAVLTNTDGEATPTLTSTRIGNDDYRVTVAATRDYRKGSSGAVTRETRNQATGQLTVSAPATVVTGDQFDMFFDVAAGPEGMTDAVLTVRVPTTGSHITPPDELVPDPANETAVLDLGDLPAEAERRVTLRWEAPGTPGFLQVAADLAAVGVAESASESVEVVPEVGGGFVFGAGLESTTESRDAPKHPDQIFGFCMGSTPPSTAAVPSFAAAREEVRTFLDAQMADRPTAAWEALAAQNDSDLLDDAAGVAFADQRYAGALAASLRAYELDPGDAVHLSNAAAAANLLDRPEWAIAFATEAARAGPAQSTGVRQEAVRLVNLGHAWALKRQFGNALAALRQAAAVDPKSQAVQAELGAVLACQGDPAGALPHIRRSLRTDDAPDPIVDEFEDESMRRSRIDSSTVFDLSEGVEQELVLPYLPATWGELAGSARALFDGSNYYERENEALKQRSFDLADKKQQLETQLRVAQANDSPAQVRRTESILSRIGTHADQDLIEARETFAEVAADTFGPNSCDGMFTSHPFCAVDGSSYSCANSLAVFNEYERRMEAHLSALATYHDAAAQHFSGLQAQLSDPVAHELAGVIAEQEFVVHVWAVTSNLRQTADLFHHYNEDWQDKEAEDPPCETVASTADLREVETARTAAPLCGPDSVASELDLNLDFDVVSVQVSCEEWSVEATREVAWLEAFAKYEAEFGNNGATLNIGVRAGAGGASFESGLYVEYDPQGKVTDYGWQVGPELEAGGVVSISAFEDKVRISFMSLFTTP